MITKLKAKHAEKTEGLRGVVYDMALRSRDIDRLLGMGVQPVTKVPHVRGNKPSAANLGTHPFIRPGHKKASELAVVAVDGTPTITLTDSKGHNHYQPLRRVQTKRKTNKQGRSIVYVKWEIPDRLLVPAHLVGAATWVRHNSTPHEAAANKRRTRALRPIPESDPDFDRLYGLREDTESANSHLKSLLPHGRARTVGLHRLRLNLIGYQLLTLNTALTAHQQRTGGDNSRWYGQSQTVRAGPQALAA